MIIYTSKPMLARKLSQIIFKNNLFPEEKIIFLSSFNFKNIFHQYPHYIEWAKTPIILDIILKIDKEENWTPMILNSYGELLNCSIDFSNLKKEQIIYAGNIDGIELNNFDFFVQKNGINKKNIQVLNLISLTDSDILKSFNLLSAYDLYSNIITIGKIKNYFNFQFNINSLIIFGKYIKNLNFKQKEIFMSKYMLQSLFFLQHTGTTTIGTFIQKMNHWNGTGKYNQKISLGSPTSFIDILENLEKLTLVDLSNNQIKLTKNGIIYLNGLHKDCKDFDLPFRIDLWSQLDFNEAKIKIDKYIQSFFGKQKRKMSEN